MTALPFQASLLDVGTRVGLEPLGGTVRRTDLGDGAWLDVRPGWITGADELFLGLLESVPWTAERRQMYDRVVDVPRLLCFYDEGVALPDPILTSARTELDHHYALDRQHAGELAETFRTAGLCLYRDGRDSVAWHGDTIGRGRTEDTMVAIVSLGAPRTLMLRPRPTDPTDPPPSRTRPAQPPTLRYELGHGDLAVMGGSCQRTWQHAIPKTARPVGPRISIQFRPRGVR